MKTIISFYQKAKSFESLGNFYDAQRETPGATATTPRMMKIDREEWMVLF